MGLKRGLPHEDVGMCAFFLAYLVYLRPGAR